MSSTTQRMSGTYVSGRAFIPKEGILNI